MTKVDRDKCEGLITADEAFKIIKSFSKNKTPGNDGLSIEWYEHFWEEIKTPLIACFNKSFQSGELSASQ